jgi:hypothetical protein
LHEFVESEEFKQQAVHPNLLWFPPGHFYSPIVDVSIVQHLFDENAKEKRVNGIDLNDAIQVENWRRFLPHFQKLPFENHEKEGLRYFYDNPQYGFGDAYVYFAMLLSRRPQKVIEIGSGHSSACLLDTVDLFFDEPVDITFIEPYPERLLSLLRKEDEGRIKIHPREVQDSDIGLFESLDAGDFLFIDSTHVLKTGSDVHFELFEIFPVLKPGVIVHFHDIFWPFEYPRSWVIEEKRSWNELYALRAFLMYNDSFKIEFFIDYFAQIHRELVEKDFPPMLKHRGAGYGSRKSSVEFRQRRNARRNLARKGRGGSVGKAIQA